MDTSARAHARELIAQAWEQSYLDLPRARELGGRVVALTDHDPLSEEAAFGWLHMALANARINGADSAQDEAERAQAIFRRLRQVRGTSLCDEVLAILCRRRGDYAGCVALHEVIDRRPNRCYDDHDQFISQSSRGVTARLLGRTDEALRLFYHAHAAATRSGRMGARLTALNNLGNYHHDLYNNEDAYTLMQAAFDESRAARVPRVLGVACCNLIKIHYARGRMDDARAMAEFLTAHPDEVPARTPETARVVLALGLYVGGDLARAQQYLDGGPGANVADGDNRDTWAWVQGRVWLAAGRTEAAIALARELIDQYQAGQSTVHPFALMELYRVAAEASETLGDLRAALAFTREAHAAYEELVGTSARARFIALEVSHEVAAARHERDEAHTARQSAEDDRRRLEELNQRLQQQIEQTRQLQLELREQALRDPLTGLYNRRYLFEVAPRMLDLARRQGSWLCLVLVDIDHFKALNDSFGHQAGDAVLKSLSALLQTRLRSTEVVCRHGGEEFVVVMPDITIEDAQVVMDRLLDACRQMPLKHDGRALPSISFSAGVAQFPRNGDGIDALLMRADRALYDAKGKGRSRIEAAPASNFAPLN
jgi:diguanylate cyclase (GGDEF)-like protein